MAGHRKIQSVAGLTGALVMLIGASFVVLARSAFDFNGPAWIKLVACTAMGLLAGTFLLQAASDLVSSEQLRHIAFDLLGQRAERMLGYLFIGWCLSLVVTHSKGHARLVGSVILTVVVSAEIYGVLVDVGGGVVPGAVRLLLLLLFVQLVLESVKAPAESGSGTL